MAEREDSRSELQPPDPGYPEVLDVWTFAAEPGGRVYLAAYGDVVILHTTEDEHPLFVDELFQLRCVGMPVEWTRSGIRNFAQFVLDNVPEEEARWVKERPVASLITHTRVPPDQS